MVELGTATMVGGLLVHRADLPAGFDSAVVTSGGRSVVLLDSGLDAVGRDVALFQCLAELEQAGKATFTAT